MPEGDTVHRIARRLRTTLGGRPVDRLFVQGHGEVEDLHGSTVTGVDVLGKHMLVHFDAGWSLRVHLGMKGKWSKRPSWEPDAPTTAVRVESGDWAYVCRRAYQTELVRTAHLGRHPRLARLGPDLLGPDPDFDQMVERARAVATRQTTEIGDLIMDQRVASGLGNVYKSEVLFLRGVHPRDPANRLSAAALLEIFQEASGLMRRNLKAGARETVPKGLRPHPASPRLWVYRRRGEPCLRCGAKIVRTVRGLQARSTYHCPDCQVEGSL